MFARWFDSAVCPIGVDLGAGSVKLMQLRRSSGPGVQVQAMSCRTLPADTPSAGPQHVAVVADLIRSMLAEGDFIGRRVVSSLPAASLQYKNLRVPKMPPNELRAAVEWEASDRLGLSAGGATPMHLQFFDAGEVRQGEEERQEIILLAAPHAVVDQHLATLVASDLKPLAIECVPSALARCVSQGKTLELDPPAQLLIDIGYAATKVLIVRAGRVLFFKLIEIGGKKFDEAVAGSLKLPVHEAAEVRRQAGSSGQADAAPVKPEIERAVVEATRPTVAEIGREIALCLRYYSVSFRGRKPEVAHLVGGEAYNAQVCRLLEGEIGVSVAPGLPANEPGLKELGHEWAVAAGLSMRQGPRRFGLPALGLHHAAAPHRGAA